MRIKVIQILVIALSLCLLGLSLAVFRPIQASDDKSSFSFLPVSSSDKTQVLHIYYSNQVELDTLARTLDVWEVHAEKGFIVAAVSLAEHQWLETAGYDYEVNTEKTASLLSPSAVLDPRFHYFDQNYVNPNDLYIVDFLQDTNAAYSNLTELIDIGNAWQANHGGPARDMWVLRVTNEDPAYGDILEKPAFFLMAEIHAREVSTPELAIRYISYLTSGFENQGGFGLDPDVTWMVNHHVIYVLVMQNPDGHVVDEANTNAMWRKNVNNADGCASPSYGVDLNRNHSFLWGCCGGSSGDPCDETYRGIAEGSEPETQAYQDYIMSVIPDQNGPNDNWTIGLTAPITTTGFFISLHSYADDILWPWFLPGYPDAPNQSQMEDIGRKMASIDTYYYPAGTIGYTVDGSANYWTYGKLGIPSFTFEVGPNYGSCYGFFPPYGCIDGIDGMPRDFWAENRPVFIYATKVARQPYMNSFGPDARNLNVTPGSVAPGTPVDLTAMIIDQRYSGDPLTPITAAEYFIDSPGPDGTGIPMLPADGNWGGTSENIQAVVDTTGLSQGQHYILVHGKNNQDMWGPFTAVFLTIANPDFGVNLEPDSAAQSGYSGWYTQYSLQITNLGNSLDTFTIETSGIWDITAPTSIGPLPPSGSELITATVYLPIEALPGESDVSTILVTSLGNPAYSDQSSLTTTAIQAGPAVSPQIASASGNPAEQVSYTLMLTNNNYITDTFYPTIQAGWDTILSPSPIGPVLPDQSVSVHITVTVPVSAPANSSDIATITFDSAIPELPSTWAEIHTTANTVFNFEVLPESDTLIGYGRGTQVEYSIQITNTGNISDSYNLILLASTWDVDIPLQIGPLENGESTTISVVVHVPFDIVMGASNEAYIAYISAGNSLISHQVHLTTDTFWYSNYLPLARRN